MSLPALVFPFKHRHSVKMISQRNYTSIILAFSLSLAALIAPTSSTTLPRHHNPPASPNPVWSVSNFKSLVTFGDSYTDESRLGWFINHNGTAPPAGTLLPESFSTPGGGRTWPRYVVQYTGETSSSGQWNPALTLYNYAVSGAVCSYGITPR